MTLKEQLVSETKELQSVLQQAEKSLKDAPEGHLRLARRGKTVQYYQRPEQKLSSEKLSQNSNQNSSRKTYDCGKYISRKQEGLPERLAQKDYDELVVKCTKERLVLLEKLLEKWDRTDIARNYENLCPERQKLISPYIATQEQYIKAWKEQTYTGKGFERGTVELFTSRGERMRSKSEIIIADMLDKYGIPYKYENPVYLHGVGTVYPDFTILNLHQRKEIYWEHFGMMDSPEYCEKALKKLETYQRNGYLLGDRLIITYETSRYPLETETMERNIRQYCLI